jgi:hypothetical protein
MLSRRRTPLPTQRVPPRHPHVSHPGADLSPSELSACRDGANDNALDAVPPNGLKPGSGRQPARSPLGPRLVTSAADEGRRQPAFPGKPVPPPSPPPTATGHRPPQPARPQSSPRPDPPRPAQRTAGTAQPARAEGTQSRTRHRECAVAQAPQPVPVPQSDRLSADATARASRPHSCPRAHRTRQYRGHASYRDPPRYRG